MRNVWGNWSTRRNPTHARESHANSTQEGLFQSFLFLENKTCASCDQHLTYSKVAIRNYGSLWNGQPVPDWNRLTCRPVKKVPPPSTQCIYKFLFFLFFCERETNRTHISCLDPWARKEEHLWRVVAFFCTTTHTLVNVGNHWRVSYDIQTAMESCCRCMLCSTRLHIWARLGNRLTPSQVSVVPLMLAQGSACSLPKRAGSFPAQVCQLLSAEARKVIKADTVQPTFPSKASARLQATGLMSDSIILTLKMTLASAYARHELMHGS